MLFVYFLYTSLVKSLQNIRQTLCYKYQFTYLCLPFREMEVVAQLVRASDCGSEGRGFETLHPPRLKILKCLTGTFFIFTSQ
jgi:hypothetical protein